MYNISHWFIFIALILGQVYRRHECTNLYGGPDRIEPGTPVTALSDEARREIESCIYQYKLYHYNEEERMERCIVAYNGLRNPDEIFVKLAESDYGRTKPPSGFRLRHEVRTLSDEQWKAVVDVFQELYKRGITQKFAMLHNHGEMRTHQGAGFLLWHRMFVLNFEEEMRKINPNVSLPYFDYTIDTELLKPEDSIVWSDCFFGNNNGPVKSGPFGYATGRYGDYVWRAAGKKKHSFLFNRADIKFMLRGICHFKDFTTGSGKHPSRHNFEPYHGQVHEWIGGDFTWAPQSAFDLIFFMHHAFIDLVYQKFRNQQMNETICGHIDIENDYRPMDDLCSVHMHHQGPDDPAPGYSHLRNKHLLWRNWTTEFYNYAPQPSCADNTCTGKYLYCNIYGVCMTRTIHDNIPCNHFKPVFGGKKAKETTEKLKSTMQQYLKFIYVDKS